MSHIKVARLTFFILSCLILSVLPEFSGAANMIDATKVGIVGDGKTLNTGSIQKAIDDASAAGGGTINFPAGRYLTGTIQIKSNVTLHLDDQAVLLGSTNAADYKNLDPFIDGIGKPLGYALVVALDSNHVGIAGNGTIDGQGAKLKANQKSFTIRPFLVRFVRDSNVTIKDVHLTNPGAWTLNFFQTKGADIDHLIIRTRDQKLANNDGINIDSSENLRIRDCDVISGDDALVIKSTSATPSRDIIASNCKLSTAANAIKLGTESFGGFENISISNCQIYNTRSSGIGLNTVDGGDLRNVTISDVTMDGVAVPISIRLGSRLTTFREGQQPKTTGRLSDITIRNVTAKNIKLIGILISGVPEHPVQNVTIENVNLTLPGGGSAEAAKIQLPENEKAYPEYNMFGKTLPASAIYARHVRGLRLESVTLNLLNPDARPKTVFIDVK